LLLFSPSERIETDIDIVRNHLRSIPFFHNFHQKEIQDISCYIKYKQVKAGEIGKISFLFISFFLFNQMKKINK